MTKKDAMPEIDLRAKTSGPENNAQENASQLSMAPAPKGKKPPQKKKAAGRRAKLSKPRKSLLRRIIGIMITLSILGCVAAAGAGYAVYRWASKDLPSFSKITDYRPPQVTNILARDGSLIGQLYREKRFLISLDQMNPLLVKAVLAVEDSDFYTHPGIDPAGIVRAVLTNFRSGQKSQGASTLTQQVVKRLMLTPEKTYERKIKEIILALRLERQLSKDDILTIYLNQSFYGNNAYGVEAAARTYFARHAYELTLAQCALIAGLPQSPSAYNPFRNPEAAQKRQRHVLQRMRSLGWISDEEYDKAYYEPLEYASMESGMGRVGMWYLEEVRRRLIDFFDEENSQKYGFDFGMYGEDVVYEGGLTVYTSMDPIQQAAADKALRTGLENASKRHGWDGPIQSLKADETEGFLRQTPFTLSMLEDGGWAKAVVTEVSARQAKVRLGSGFKGVIPVTAMGWARKPNIAVAGSVNSNAVQDATKVLAPGDVVHVSLRVPKPAKGQAAFSLAEATAETEIPLALEQYPAVQGALVSIEPESCDVVALVGGYEFGGSVGSQFNRATQALRQPGSSFKPIVYCAALDNGFSPASTILDAPLMVVNGSGNSAWRPQNSERNFLGPLPLYKAMALSRNLCAVRVAEAIGVDAIIDRARQLGYTEDFPPVLSISLGSVEVTPINHVCAYTAFANQGKVSVPRFVQKIVGPWGNTIYTAESEHYDGISPQNAYVMSGMLKGNVLYGTGSKARVLGRPVGGKTGTTNDQKDAWFMAVTPHLVTATYVGYDKVQPMGRGETGSGAALPIYIDYAKAALEAYSADDFVRPSGIVMANAGGATMPFIEGTEPGKGNAIDLGGNIHIKPSDAEDLMMQGF
ncbi:MAG: PBP1A family penicillin-binding protein [Mailhella sp.]|nr:PBP1A family penicillin-binding protein [Mailhella sp.]